MKKVFLSLAAIAVFGASSLTASEQQEQPASMFEALRSLPGAQGKTEAELSDLKAYLEDLQATFASHINPAFENVGTRNPKGLEVFKEVVGADKFVITLQPLSMTDSVKADITGDEYDDSVVDLDGGDYYEEEA